MPGQGLPWTNPNQQGVVNRWVYYDTASPVNMGGVTVTDFAMGHFFVCAIVDNGTVRCWGSIGPWLGFPVPSDGMHTLQDGWGNFPTDMGSNLPEVDVGGFAVQIAAGYDHACVILTNGTAKCWGNNGWCQLGVTCGTSIGGSAGQMVTTTRNQILLNLCAFVLHETVKFFLGITLTYNQFWNSNYRLVRCMW